MAIVTPAQEEQKNVAINPSMKLVFFQDQALVYNYGTDQWSRLSVVDNRRIFSVQDPDRVLGTVLGSTLFDTVLVSDSTFTAAAVSTVSFVTAEFELDPGFQSNVIGCQPLGDSVSVNNIRITSRDLLTEAQATTTVTGSAVNSRTGFAEFRGAATYTTGAYHSANLQLTSEFNAVTGAYFEFFRTGRV